MERAVASAFAAASHIIGSGGGSAFSSFTVGQQSEVLPSAVRRSSLRDIPVVDRQQRGGNGVADPMQFYAAISLPRLLAAFGSYIASSSQPQQQQMFLPFRAVLFAVRSAGLSVGESDDALRTAVASFKEQLAAACLPVLCGGASIDIVLMPRPPLLSGNVEPRDWDLAAGATLAEALRGVCRVTVSRARSTSEIGSKVARALLDHSQ